MSFKEFDLSDYIEALNDFKKSNAGAITECWGSIQNFDMYVEKVKESESEIAKMAIQQYGSVEKFNEAMKCNLENFPEIMNQKITDEVKEIGKQSDNLYARLLEDMTRDITSDKIQDIVKDIVAFMQEYTAGGLEGESLSKVVIDSYSGDYIRTVTDRKYGVGASDYIVNTFQYYSISSIDYKNGLK